jgi:hypothetical protein
MLLLLLFVENKTYGFGDGFECSAVHIKIYENWSAGSKVEMDRHRQPGDFIT